MAQGTCRFSPAALAVFVMLPAREGEGHSSNPLRAALGIYLLLLPLQKEHWQRYEFVKFMIKVSLDESAFMLNIGAF